MRLDTFDNTQFRRGRSRLVEALWVAVGGLLFSSWIPGSAWRAWLLRAFGAHVGTGVVIKPRVRITFPWKLQVGDHSWIGEQVWIDNLDQVAIGSHCCISQRAYLCTGSHRWDLPTFDLVTRPIRIADHCWLAAHCRVAPGVAVEEGAVLTFASVAFNDLSAWTIHHGNPAQAVKPRPRA